ncbi:glycosyltransferase family 2 protein [Henriciella aquimarina]|uniref:glycosyltransferase family 2 protein n=1 Tax=Henriciella aquimarina TaxID=545261 RepID=UPI000A01135C|nr:glycosyltransferase [Henriciella aquimarina]
MEQARPRLAVVIASLGRPETVREALDALAGQSRPADTIVLSVTGPQDLPGEADLSGEHIRVVEGEKGLCNQRNRALDALAGDADYIVFFDDDYVPSRYALEGIEAFFEAHPEIAGITGHLIADGIKGPGIGYKEACQRVRAYDECPRPEPVILEKLEGLYGCNMAYRASAIGETRFDETLPYYAWLEDVDFANRIMARGDLVRTNAFAGIHCGVKSARSPGVRLGYSQVANPLYLVEKGTLRRATALRLISRNLLANHAKTLRPEPWVDRWGRTKGNWLAFRHLLSGKLSPEYIRHL